MSVNNNFKFKINVDNKESLINYLIEKEVIFNKRERFLNKLLEVDEINNDYYINTIGQLFETKYDLTISLYRVSHFLKNVQYINDEYIGHIEILNTQDGNMLKYMIEQGCNFYLQPIYNYFDRNKIIRIDIKNDYQ